MGPGHTSVGVGFYIIGCILGGIVGGLWLDRKLNTEPIFLLVGLVLGLVVASWCIQMLIPMIKDNKKDRR